MYDGWDHTDSACHVSNATEGHVCTVRISPLLTPSSTSRSRETFLSRSTSTTSWTTSTRYLHGGSHSQNHREYINSIDYDQLGGADLDGKALESSCGSKTYADEASTKVLVPCGYIANSFFNDVFTLLTPNLTLNEHDISYAPDRSRFKNPPNYGQPSATRQYM